MIDRYLLDQYHTAFGNTFTVMLWDQHPDETVNGMMREALSGTGQVVTDGRIAAELVD